jgi:tripartite-type tricarboxylate transporter receptor subunit TctC
MSNLSLSSTLRFLTIIGISLMSMPINAQSYPNRPITFVVPYGPGGSTDPVARQYAMQLQKALGVEVNIENKPGGSGTIGTGLVVRSKPDGYTLGLATNTLEDLRRVCTTRKR